MLVPAVFHAVQRALLYRGLFCCCPTRGELWGSYAVDLADVFLARAQLSASELHKVQDTSQQQATPHDLMRRKVISVVHASMLNSSTKNFTAPITV